MSEWRAREKGKVKERDKGGREIVKIEKEEKRGRKERERE